MRSRKAYHPSHWICYNKIHIYILTSSPTYLLHHHVKNDFHHILHIGWTTISKARSEEKRINLKKKSHKLCNPRGGPRWATQYCVQRNFDSMYMEKSMFFLTKWTKNSVYFLCVSFPHKISLQKLFVPDPCYLLCYSPLYLLISPNKSL